MNRVDSRKFAKILRLRGCVHVRDKGGHSIWQAPNGEMIVAVQAGRPTDITPNAIHNAARTLGITARELLATRKRVAA